METRKASRLSTEAKLLENTLELSARFRLVLYAFLQVYDVEQWHLRQALETYLKDHPADQTRYLLFLGHDPFAAHIYWIGQKYPQFAVEVIDRDPEEMAMLRELFHQLGLRNISFYTFDEHNFPAHTCYDYVGSIYRSSFDAIDVERMAGALKPSGVFVGLFRRVRPEDMPAFRAHVKARLQSAGFKRIKFRWVYGRPAVWSYRLSVWPIRLLRLRMFFLPFALLYYALMLPLVALLNYLDAHMVHPRGRVVMVRAQKAP